MRPMTRPLEPTIVHASGSDHGCDQGRSTSRPKWLDAHAAAVAVGRMCPSTPRLAEAVGSVGSRRLVINRPGPSRTVEQVELATAPLGPLVECQPPARSLRPRPTGGVRGGLPSATGDHRGRLESNQPSGLPRVSWSRDSGSSRPQVAGQVGRPPTGGEQVERPPSETRVDTHVFPWLPPVMDDSMIPVIRLHEREGRPPSTEAGQLQTVSSRARGLVSG